MRRAAAEPPEPTAPRTTVDLSPSDLLRDVEGLELVARRNVTSLVTGSYLTAFRGQGLEFHEARKYVEGESARRIDWKISARLDAPHVRVHLEERQREVVIAVDVSGSMTTGWQTRTKLELAVEVAATLALSATDADDRVGLVTFTDRSIAVLPPRHGRRALGPVLAELALRLVDPPAGGGSDPRAAIHEIERLRGRRLVVFLISDFLDHDVPDDLAYLRRRHDVSLVHVYDRVEHAAASPVRWLAAAPEGGGGPTVVAPGESNPLEPEVAALSAAAARLQLGFVSVATADPVGRRLGAFFHGKQRTRLRV